MFIIYDDQPKTGGGFNPMELDPHKMYRKHLENWYYLNFIAIRSNLFNEKAQARKELEICTKKLTYWKKHTDFDKEVAAQITDNVKRTWMQDKG
jgi:hypothetical protein